MHLIWLLLIGFLVACSDPHAGGPSSVETQNSIAGVILSNAGTPEVSAQVQLFYANSYSATPIAQTTSDSLGKYAFTVKDSALYSVIVQKKNVPFARILQKGKSNKTVIDTTVLHAQNVDSLYTWIDLNANNFLENKDLKVSILGTPISINWNSDTALRLATPGFGAFTLQISNAGSLYEETIFVANLTDTLYINPSELPSFLLTDFEYSCSQNNLAHLFGDGWNFVVINDGFTIPEYSKTDFTQNCHDDAEKGNVAHVSYVPTGNIPWFILGSNLGLIEKGIRLTDIDSLVVWLKGSGTVGIGFVTQDILLYGDHGYFQVKDVELTLDWVRHSIPIADFEIPPGTLADKNNLKWLTSALDTRLLQFTTSGNIDLWIDEIRLVGVSISDF